MRKSFYIITFLFLSVTTKGQYIIPGAAVQPAWVFPIYFEDGNSERDTLYIGYDPSADTCYGFAIHDTIFGVKKVKVDTTHFFAEWAQVFSCGTQPICDSVYKVNVNSVGCSYYRFPPSPSILLASGIFPFKISWDVSTLYSDSLPYSHNSSLPKAEGKLQFNFSNTIAQENGIYLCNEMTGALLITDTFTIADCHSRDSVTFHKNSGNPNISTMSGYLNFVIEQWSGIFLVANSDQFFVDSELNLYPNPTDKYFKIKTSFKKNSWIKISDIFGRLIIFENLEGDESINTSSLESGIYLIQIKSPESILSHKLIVSH